MPELLRRASHYALVTAVVAVLWTVAQTKRDASRSVGTWLEGPGVTRTGNPYARTDGEYHALIRRLDAGEIAGPHADVQQAEAEGRPLGGATATAAPDELIPY